MCRLSAWLTGSTNWLLKRLINNVCHVSRRSGQLIMMSIMVDKSLLKPKLLTPEQLKAELSASAQRLADGLYKLVTEAAN